MNKKTNFCLNLEIGLVGIVIFSIVSISFIRITYSNGIVEEILLLGIKISLIILSILFTYFELSLMGDLWEKLDEIEQKMFKVQTIAMVIFLLVTVFLAFVIAISWI